MPLLGGTGSRRQEKALVRRMLAGDEAAFDEFADDYIPVVHRFAMRRLGGDLELAREMVQNTMCKAIAKLPSFRGEAALTTWLCACCRNEIAAHFRRRGRSIQEVGLASDEVLAAAPAPGRTPPEGPEETTLRGESSRLVHDTLDALPPHYGKVLEWKYLEELPVKEIAARLDIGPKAAESLLTRARNSFRQDFMRRQGGPELAVLAAPAGRLKEAVR